MRFTFLALLLAFATPAFAVDDELNFFEQLNADATGDGEPPVTSAFECYDHTSDYDRTICLDPEIGLLYEQMERQYSIRLANTPLSGQSELARRHRKWGVDTKVICSTDLICIRIALQQHMLFLHQAPIIHRQQVILKKGEPPVQIAVTGRQTTNGYLLHSLLLVDTDSYGREKIRWRSDFYQLMRSRYYELLHPQPNPFLLDANFDGWQDLVFLTGERAQDIHRIYYLYDPKKGIFFTDGRLNALQNPVFLDEHQIVSMPWAKADSHGIDYYVYKNNKLSRDARVVYTQVTDTDGSQQIMMSTFSNRTGRMVKTDDRPISSEHFGKLPDFYTALPAQDGSGATAQDKP